MANISLYEMEESLLAFLHTEDIVDEAQKAEFYAELGEALTATVEKRERVAQFLSHLDSQVELSKKERERLRLRQERLERVRDELEAYVVRVIERLGPDGKGKLRKLEGRTVTLSAVGIPPAVEITDPSKVPMEFRRVRLTLPETLWSDVVCSLGEDLRKHVADIAVAEYEPFKSLLKMGIEAAARPGEIEEAKKSGALSVQSTAVPGARLNINRHRLVRR